MYQKHASYLISLSNGGASLIASLLPSLQSCLFPTANNSLYLDLVSGYANVQIPVFSIREKQHARTGTVSVRMK